MTVQRPTWLSAPPGALKNTQALHWNLTSQPSSACANPLALVHAYPAWTWQSLSSQFLHHSHSQCPALSPHDQPSPAPAGSAMPSQALHPYPDSLTVLPAPRDQSHYLYPRWQHLLHSQLVPDWHCLTNLVSSSSPAKKSRSPFGDSLSAPSHSSVSKGYCAFDPNSHSLSTILSHSSPRKQRAARKDCSAPPSSFSLLISFPLRSYFPTTHSSTCAPVVTPNLPLIHKTQRRASVSQIWSNG